MLDLLERGSSWLEDMRTRFAARKVIYQRGLVGSGPSAEVRATIGQTSFDVDNGTGALIRVESRDYLILTVDLVLAGQPELPKPGDTIRETLAGDVLTYEVMSPAPSAEPHFRYSDPWRKTLRIHTKLVKSEAA